MLIFLSIPSVFAVSHVAYNDLFVTFFTLAAIYSFFRWSEQRLTAWLILCGIFSGSAAACKYTALLLTPLGCLGILWFASRRKTETRQALRLLALYVAAAFIAGSPFYLKNWIVTGNPFYPFFYGIFGGRGWDRRSGAPLRSLHPKPRHGKRSAGLSPPPLEREPPGENGQSAVRRHSGTDLSSDPSLSCRTSPLGNAGSGDSDLCPFDLPLLGLFRPADPLSDPPLSPSCPGYRGDPDPLSKPEDGSSASCSASSPEASPSTAIILSADS